MTLRYTGLGLCLRRRRMGVPLGLHIVRQIRYDRHGSSRRSVLCGEVTRRLRWRRRRAGLGCRNEATLRTIGSRQLIRAGWLRLPQPANSRRLCGIIGGTGTQQFQRCSQRRSRQ